MTSSTFSTQVIVLGDRGTGDRFAMLASRAGECGVTIADIHIFEPGQARLHDDLAEVDAVVAALSRAIRTRSNVWVPFPSDLHREEHSRRLSLVLQRHGVNLLLGRNLRPCPLHGGINAVDAALRREVHAVDDLDRAALAAAGAHTLAAEIELVLQHGDGQDDGRPAERPHEQRPDLLQHLDAEYGPQPPLPATTAVWQRRRPALKRFSWWLVDRCGLTQTEAAEILNGLGHRTPSGRIWQRCTVSALINGRYDRRAAA